MRTATILATMSLAACARQPEPFAASANALIAVDDLLAFRTDEGGLVVVAPDGSRRTETKPLETYGCGEGTMRATVNGIYWTDCDDAMWRADRDGSHAARLPISTSFLSGFAVDADYVYAGSYELNAYPIAGGTREVRTTRDVVVDSIATADGEVYFGAGARWLGSDVVGGVYRASDERLVIRHSTDIIRHLVAGEGVLAWSDREDATYRANTDGTDVKRIGVLRDYDAARAGLQIHGGRIWWATLDDVVVSTALDGSDAREHYRGSSWVRGPAIVDGVLYVLESDGERIGRRSLAAPWTYHLVAIDL